MKKIVGGLALLVSLSLGVAETAEAGPGDKPSVPWANSWKEAVKEATARNVPIFVSFHQDN